MAPQKHIDPGVASAMILFGVLIDLLQFALTIFGIGLFIGPALSALAMFVFWAFFPRPGPSTALFGVAELIPGFGALPLWSVYAARIVFFDRFNDSENLPIGKQTKRQQRVALAKTRSTRQSWMRRL